MQYKAILFDMDGTLLPMNVKQFEEGYYKLVGRYLAKRGFDPRKAGMGLMEGCRAMIRNDGSQLNDDAFWNTVIAVTGLKRAELEPPLQEFYCTEFALAKQLTGENELAKEAVMYAHKAAPIVALATNPFFPLEAQEMRLSWVDVDKTAFDLITTCRTDYYCKPSIGYYIDVCRRLGVKPDECLMIGNDEAEDMYPAAQLGMDCYLVTDSVIRSEEHPWSGKSGTFAELTEYLKNVSEYHGA